MLYFIYLPQGPSCAWPSPEGRKACRADYLEPAPFVRKGLNHLRKLPRRRVQHVSLCPRVYRQEQHLGKSQILTPIFCQPIMRRINFRTWSPCLAVRQLLSRQIGENSRRGVLRPLKICASGYHHRQSASNYVPPQRMAYCRD